MKRKRKADGGAVDDKSNQYPQDQGQGNAQGQSQNQTQVSPYYQKQVQDFMNGLNAPAQGNKK